MDKNWLIRTKSNHILGPVSKEKVIELYQNGSLKSGDEICSGNGYWFFIREEDMVARFLLGNEVQPFNPLSEAKDVLTAPQTSDTTEELIESENSSPDITLVGSINLDALAEESSTEEPPPETDPSNSPSGAEDPLPREEQKKKLNLS